MILEPLNFVSSSSLIEECLQYINLESRKGVNEKGLFEIAHNLHRHTNDTRTFQDRVPE